MTIDDLRKMLTRANGSRHVFIALPDLTETDTSEGQTALDVTIDALCDGDNIEVTGAELDDDGDLVLCLALLDVEPGEGCDDDDDDDDEGDDDA